MPIARILYQSVVWKGMFYVSAFLLNIFIARHFEAAVSGNIYYIINAFTLIHLATSLSLEAGMGYFVSRKQIDPARLLNFSVLWAIFLGVLVFLILRYFTDITYQGVNPETLRIYCFFFTCGNILFTYASSICYAQNNFLIPNVVSLFHNLFLIICIPFGDASLIAGVNNDNYFYLFFGAYLSQGIVTALVVQFASIKHFSFQLPSGPEFKKLWKFSSLAFAGNIVFFFLYRVDYLFVEKFCSTAELGNYIQVSKLGQLFFLLPTMLATAIFPLTASDEKNAMPRWLAIISRIILFFYAVICLVLIIIGRWFFPFVFGESFTDMYPAFVCLVPGILSLSILFTLAAYNGGKNKQRENLVGCILALVFVVAGNWLFVPKYGINAAACVSSAGYMIYVAYILYDFKKDNDFTLRSFFVFRLQDISDIKRLLTSSKSLQQDVRN